jgi:hypothetical protein
VQIWTVQTVRDAMGGGPFAGARNRRLTHQMRPKDSSSTDVPPTFPAPPGPYIRLLQFGSRSPTSGRRSNERRGVDVPGLPDQVSRTSPKHPWLPLKTDPSVKSSARSSASSGRPPAMPLNSLLFPVSSRSSRFCSSSYTVVSGPPAPERGDNSGSSSLGRCSSTAFSRSCPSP